MTSAVADNACQIYLAVPAGAAINPVAALLAGERIACVLLHGEGGAPVPEDTVRQFTALAHGHAVPLLVADDPQLARAAGADGVHIPANEALYSQARQLLGPAAMIGAGCGTSRHDALVLAEQGADYIAFGPEPGGGDASTEETAALAQWWQEVCEPPVVAWHAGGMDEAAVLIAAGADFIGVSALILDAESPLKALEQLIDLIANRCDEGQDEGK